MPELPEVETVKKGLEKAIIGRNIAQVDLRRAGLRAAFPLHFAKTLTGRAVLSLRRRAKYILVDLEGGYTWLVHLGMSGSFRLIQPRTRFTPTTHDHVVITFQDGLKLVYNDPRRFGQMDVFLKAEEPQNSSLAKLGPEPLDDGFCGSVLAKALAGKTSAIKIALLDQKILAGVGNIYACEALYMAGINPTRIANTLKGKKADLLAGAIKAVMQAALASGGSTLRDHKQLDGSTGYFQHSFAVYGQEGLPCKDCTCSQKHVVRSITQAGRTTFYCPVKQR